MIHSVRYHVPGQNVLVPHLLSPLVLVYYVHMQSVESVGHVNLSGIRIASRLASGWTRIRHFSEIEKKEWGRQKKRHFCSAPALSIHAGYVRSSVIPSIQIPVAALHMFLSCAVSKTSQERAT